MKLVSLHASAKSVTINSPIEQIMSLLSPFGDIDRSLVEKVQFAAGLASSNPAQTVEQFIADGGLLRLLAGQKHDPNASDIHPIECPHCAQVIFL